MVGIKDREQEQVVLVDVSAAANSAHALKVLEGVAATPGGLQRGSRVALNGGSLLLTQKVLAKMGELIRQSGAWLETVYASLPQTQQAALGCGFFVRENPGKEADPGAGRRDLFGAGQFKAALQEKINHPNVDHLSVDHLVEGQAGRKKVPSAALGAFVFRQQLARGEASAVDLPFGDTMSLDPAEALKDVTFLSQSLPALAVERVPSAEQPEPASELLATGPVFPPPFEPDAIEPQRPTLYWKNTLRSGQVIRYDGNLVVLGDVHGGSEISATGHVLIWGELRGIAHAGAAGDRRAEIRALRIEAIQLRIADKIARRPDRIHYHKPPEAEGGPLRPVRPEVAQIVEGEIKIFNDIIGT